jgi:hypothetical protein
MSAEMADADDGYSKRHTRVAVGIDNVVSII